MITDAVRPRPVPDELTEPYWDGVRLHELRIQRCQACRAYQHPPRIYCTTCSEGALAFEPVSGRATVYSYSLIVESATPGLEAPFTVVIAELSEQPGLWVMSTLPSDVEVHVGDPLEVTFEDVGGFTLPQFVPATERTS